MDRIAEWRPVEPAGPDGSAEPAPDGPEWSEPDEPPNSARVAQPKPPLDAASWRLVGPVLIGLTVVGFVIAGVVAVFVLSTMPKAVVAIDAAASARPAGSGSASASLALATDGPAVVVVDVEGAVAQPGVWHLPIGSRIGDAIDAAGGYSAQVDIDGATSQLNLAEALVDGQKIRVPLRGERAVETAAAGTPTTSTTGAPGALIDVNSASADQLDSLPGIGPVTAGKIIAARPFASIDDLQQRGVVGASTLDKIRSLITVKP